MESHFMIAVQESLIESLKHTGLMLPVLFAAFLLMETVNHSAKTTRLAGAARHAVFGPVVAAVLGLLPQCGFSVAATTLFLEGLIPTGSLLAVYIATSDEAMPVLIGNPDTLPWVLPLLATKLAWGSIVGIAVNLAFRNRASSNKKNSRQANAHSEDPSIKSQGIGGSCAGHPAPNGWRDYFAHAGIRTARVGAMVFVLSSVLHVAGHILSDKMGPVLGGGGLIQPLAASFLGLIPSCATSVAMAEAFRAGLMSFPAIVSGLTSNAGIGLLVLIKENRQPGQSLSIVAMLVASAVLVGLLASFLV